MPYFHPCVQTPALNWKLFTSAHCRFGLFGKSYMPELFHPFTHTCAGSIDEMRPRP